MTKTGTGQELRIDLTKTVIVAILALLLQGLMYYYLTSGGWDNVLKLLNSFGLERG